MSHIRIWLCALLLLMSCCLDGLAQQTIGASANVVVPPLMKFSGVLSEANGKPLTRIAGVTFSLYKDSQGGAPLWVETQNVQPDITPSSLGRRLPKVCRRAFSFRAKRAGWAYSPKDKRNNHASC